ADLVLYSHLCVFFFFQAEDGIRDRNVTGVQTCALPIWGSRGRNPIERVSPSVRFFGYFLSAQKVTRIRAGEAREPSNRMAAIREIGRASCRERVERWGGGGVWRETQRREKREQGGVDDR